MGGENKCMGLEREARRCWIGVKDQFGIGSRSGRHEVGEMVKDGFMYVWYAREFRYLGCSSSWKRHPFWTPYPFAVFQCGG